ncbi:hypothetical protein PDESU_03211 [Pontiella desulfatans]|uniref:Uncharacterized protein n=1 Tax=Pontiella desulfatans TaxID=2750659 RepID=A0A6C2U5H4_PONDE|nr:hypothetical protein [Pontiella desulfatans]VGO14646.1 hypothetical protein PDESU_03211 [Pontiella desulfatans]
MKNHIREVIKRHSGAWRQSAGLLLIPLLMVSHKANAISRMDVHGGSLFVGASLSVDELHVDAGAILGGPGMIDGNVTVEGTVNPAVSTPSPTTLTIAGNVDFLAGSTFRCHATSHTQCDKLDITGFVGGTCTVDPSKSSSAIPVNQWIIDASDGFYLLFSLTPADEADWAISTGDSIDLLLTHTTGDSDSNGLPDWYELEYFSVRTGTDPDGHGDDDGMTNGEELVAGTDPTDGSSTFALKLVYLGDDDFRVEWPSVAGRTYSIYFGEDVSLRTTPVFEDMSAQPPTNYLGLSNWSVLIDTTFIHGTVERTE